MQWHGIGVGVVFILSTTALVGIVYGLMRFAASKRSGDDTRELAGSVIFRVAALHGLILALVFSQELADYNEIRGDLVREATAVADIYNDIHRYDPALAPVTQQVLSDYVHAVVDEEWTALGRTGGLTTQGWAYREALYQAVLDLTPETLRQTDLRAHMVSRAQEIATLRQQRENSAVHHMGSMFWFAAFAGLVLVAMPYFIFAPTPLNIALLSVYGSFSGLIMFMIYAFSNPFASPGALYPVAFERLLDTEIGAGPRPGS